MNNPFDADDIKLDAYVQTPSGKRLVVPGFFNGEKRGASHWQVRFTPREVGTYSYSMTIVMKDSKISTGDYDLVVSKSNSDGFLSMANSPFFLRFDSGKEFRGIGENIPNLRPWLAGNSEAAAKALKGKAPYGYYFKKLSANGGNLIRKWIGLPGSAASSFEYLNWPQGAIDKNIQRSRSKAHPPGRYDLNRLKELDTLFESARKYGVYVMLCINTGHSFKHSWDYNPYNKVNGGPCVTPKDFFTDAEAKRLTRNKLRYLIARYGYTPYLMTWEFWNELNCVPGVPLNVMVSWHKQMGSFLEKNDPYGHPISTSVSGASDYHALWSIKQLDYIQTHCYSDRDPAYAMYALNKNYVEKYGKPNVIGEFGISGGQTLEKDPLWRHLDRGLWGTCFSPTPILALEWFREELDLTNAYHHFKPIAKFNKLLLQEKGNYVDFKLPAIPLKRSGTLYKTLYPVEGWFKENWQKVREHVITVDRDGCVLKNNMTGQLKSDFPLTFELDLKEAGRFGFNPEVIRHKMDDKWGLSIYLDEKKVYKWKITAKKLKVAKAKAGKANKKMRIAVEEIAIDVPAGTHKIRIEATPESKVICIEQYDITGLGNAGRSCVMPYGLRKGALTAVWFKRTGVSWADLFDSGRKKKEPAALQNVACSIPVETDGIYAVRWIDTRTGTFAPIKQVQSMNKHLKLTLPSFVYDICVTIRKKQ